MSKTIKLTDPLSCAEAADILGVIPVRVRQLCQEGRMGTKIAGRWLIDRKEVNRYKKQRRPPGRPEKV